MLLNLLLYASFLANIGIGILNFSLVFYMRDLFDASSAQIGLLSSLWALAYLAGCFVLHRVSGKLGPKRSLSLAALGMALFSVLILKSPSITFLYIYAALFGFVTALFWPPLEGWLSEGYEGSALNKRVGRFNLSWSAALTLSPYIAGVLIEKSLTLPLIVTIGVYILLFSSFLVVSTFFLKNNGHPVLKADSASEREDTSTPLRFIAWMGIFSSYLINGIVLFVFPLYAREILLIQESSIGLLFLLRALLSTGVFVFMSRTVCWHFKKLQMLFIQLVLVLFCAALPFFKTWSSLAVMFSFFGILFAFQYSNSLFHGVSGSVNREKRMAVHEGVLTAGLISGAVGGGVVYQLFGVTVLFYGAGTVLFIILILQLAVLILQKGMEAEISKS